MTAIDLNDFSQEKECHYKGEKYSVRDNGAVLRHPREGKHPRPTDNQWTFGKPNDRTGYMEIASVRVHRIVATAFHGEPPTSEHVVDHIDTNRRNNRPDNLRWLTRLENALLNPITAKKIIAICGSLEAFLADPTLIRKADVEPNIQWMRTVSPQEAQICLQNMRNWANSDKSSSGGSIGEWIFTRNIPLRKNTYKVVPDPKPVITGHPLEKFRKHMLVMAKTPGAAQRNNWRIPSDFPCCPQGVVEKHIEAYAEKLKEGVVFCQNNTYKSIVLKIAITDEGKSLYVMCESGDKENAVKPWSLAQVTYEDGLYVHTNHHQFFTKEGVEKQFCLAQGLEWTGGDSIDDYC